MRSLLGNLLWRLLQPRLETRLKPIEDGLAKGDGDLTKSVQDLWNAQRSASRAIWDELEDLRSRPPGASVGPRG